MSGSNMDCSRGVCSPVFSAKLDGIFGINDKEFSVGLLALSAGLVAISVGLVTDSDGFTADSCTWLVSEGSPFPAITERVSSFSSTSSQFSLCP